MKPLTRSMTLVITFLTALVVGSSPATAIVDGHDASQAYAGIASLNVALSDGRTAWCGATLIRPAWLLTAAHCVSEDAAAPAGVPVPGSTVTARVGATDRTKGTLVTGKTVFLHPDWAWGMPTGKPVSDLALVELTRPAGVPVMPVGARQVRENQALRTIGWGLTEFPPTSPNPVPIMLQEHDTTRLPSSVCANGFVSAGEICVGPESGGCFGDSGGPALRPLHTGPRGDRRWATVGITSRGITEEPSCGGPGIWTDPTYGPHRTWIAKTILNLNPKAWPCTCPPTPYAAADSKRADRFKPLITT